jgi:hypothetical protein
VRFPVDRVQVNFVHGGRPTVVVVPSGHERDRGVMARR